MNDKGYDPDRFAKGGLIRKAIRYRVGQETPETVVPRQVLRPHDSFIRVGQIAGALGPEGFTYTWVQGQTRDAFINPHLLRATDCRLDEWEVRPGTILTLGGLRLRVVRNDYPCGYIIVERDGWRAALRAYGEIARRPADRVYRRLIVTAAVWGLARYNPGMVPTWRDLRWPWRKDA